MSAAKRETLDLSAHVTATYFRVATADDRGERVVLLISTTEIPGLLPVGLYVRLPLAEVQAVIGRLQAAMTELAAYEMAKARPPGLA